MIELSALHDEVLAGLKNEQNRLDDAKENADFFRGEFDAYGNRPPSSAWEGARNKCDSRIMTWLVETLAMNLYGSGPTRSLPDHKAAAEWLNAIYKTSAMDALLQSADQWSTVSQVSAIQVIPTEDQARPVKHALWPAHQICVWESEDDPLIPEAVATIDKYDNRKRLRLWTADARVTYVTDKLESDRGQGQRAYKLVKTEANPFGFLPFSFVHYNFPTTEFWSGAPGTTFKELNDYLNCSLTDSGDSIRFCLKPIVKALGVRAGWRPRTPVQPGDIWDIPAEGMDADGNGIPPDVGYMQPDTNFVDAHWLDLQNRLDHAMQCAGVPPSFFRLVQDSASSGLAIIAEQLPLILRAEGRERTFGYYEAELAKVTLAVGASHLGRNGIAAAAEQLRQAAADPGLTLRWPCLRPKLSGVEANASNKIALDEKTISRTMIVMQRENLTREEAEQYLDQVARDLEREQALFARLDPVQVDPESQAKPPTSADAAELDTEDESETDG
jgi:hypothetical protein